MIRESLYFSFDGIKSTEYPIANVNVGGGLYEESVTSGQQINETYPREAFKPYLFGTQKEVKQFDFSFAFLEPWNDRIIDEIIRWLNVDDYKKLFFEGDIDKVFYAMPLSDINLIHNGLKEGYLTLTVRCDSGYSYSHEMMTKWYDFSTKESEKIIEIKNLGHYPIYPNIEIKKVGEGDLKVNNLSVDNDEFKFTGLFDGEIIGIDNFNEIIETNIENKHRYDDFNDNYLELPYGKNTLQITGECYIKFEYQYIFS